MVSNFVDDVACILLDPRGIEGIQRGRFCEKWEDNLEVVCLGGVHEGNVVRAYDCLVCVSSVCDGCLSDGEGVVYANGIDAKLLDEGKVSLPKSSEPAVGVTKSINCSVEIVLRVTARSLDDSRMRTSGISWSGFAKTSSLILSIVDFLERRGGVSHTFDEILIFAYKESEVFNLDVCGECC